MESEYKLSKYVDKIPHFARVTVESEFLPSGTNVLDDIREPLDRGRAEVSRKGYSDWIDAAVAGAQLCADILIEQGRISGCRVTIVRVVGVDTDTAAENVFCAAALATWQTLVPDSALPTFDFKEDKCEIHFK